MAKLRMNTRVFAKHLMGRMVRVHHVYKREEERPAQTGQEKTGRTDWLYAINWAAVAVEETEQRVGWITGLRWLCPGMVVDGDSVGPEYEPPHYLTTGHVPAVLVSYWPTEKPVPVPLDGYIIAQGTLMPYPAIGVGVGKERERSRAYLKKWAGPDGQPRNGKGQFVTSQAYKLAGGKP